MKMSEPSQQTFLNETEFPLMSSPGASRAKTFPLLENKPGSAMKPEAACGPKSSDLLASYDRATSSWRTSQTCLVALEANEADGLAEFSETWPSAGMMRNGKTYRRQPWALPIAESASGLLPTPTKSADSKGAPKNRFFGSKTCRSNLREVLRNGPDDPVFPNPLFVEEMMGFPRFHTDLQPSETQLSRKSPK